jgi:hypothetical protein
VEVQATTTTVCLAGGPATTEVNGLTVDKLSPNQRFCWAATQDSCAVGYDVLASDDKTSDANWTVVSQIGLTPCWAGNPSQKFYLIRTRGTGGDGPWGHYQH